MTAAPIHVAGERLMLDPAGALFWPAASLLAVSDLHLENRAAYARKGALLPAWDTRGTLDRLALLLRYWSPRIVVALGASFTDKAGAARLPPGEAARLRTIIAERRFVWVTGIHDPGPPRGLGGECVASFSLGPLVFRDQAEPTAEPGEISGHYHPRAAMPSRGGTASRPCFVTDGRRVVLPAFGADTIGLDVAAQAVSRLFPRGGRAFLLGRKRLFSFAFGALRRGAA
jgi:uncharacterized protein